MRHRTKRFVYLALTVALVMAIALTGCGGAQPASEPAGSQSSQQAGEPAGQQQAQPAGEFSLKGKKLAFVLWSFDGYQQAQGGWFKKAAEELGAEVQLIDGKADVTVQTRAIEDLIAGGIDGIVFQPVDPAAALIPIQEIQKANIPLVLVLAKPGEVTAPYVSLDQSSVARQAGVNAANFVKQQFSGQTARVVLFNLKEIEYCRVDRMGSFLEGVQSVFPDTVVVFDDSITPWSRENGLKKMEDILQAQPEFNIFTGCGADAALGGVQALQAVGRAQAVNKVPQTEYVFTIDATPAEIDLLLDANSSVMQTMTLVPRETGKAAADLMVKQLKGELKPNSDVTVDVPTILLPPNCGEVAKIFEEQYGLIKEYQPIDCSKYSS